MKTFVGLLLACSLGCGTSATIYTVNGGVYDGRIGGHHDGAVWINGQAIPDREIEDIDHPGNVAGVIGTIVATVGALTATHNCKKDVVAVDSAPCSGSGVWILTGLPIAIYGWVINGESIHRAGGQ